MSGPLLLPTWEQLAARPQLVDTMRRYLDQIACVLRPGSVNGADLALRSFAAFLIQTTPEVTSTAQVTRRHIENYKPWLAKRPGQNKTQVTSATLAHRLGTLRMFFVRIDEWGWDEAPQRVPMFPGDLPRQNSSMPISPKRPTMSWKYSTDCQGVSGGKQTSECRIVVGSRPALTQRSSNRRSAMTA